MSIKNLAEERNGLQERTTNGHPTVAQPSGAADAPHERGTGQPAFELLAEWVGKKCRITAKVGGGEVVHLHAFDPASETQRARFARTVHEKRLAVLAEQIETELLKIAARDGSETGETAPAASVKPPEPPADIRAEAEDLLTDPQLIGRVCDDIATLGVVGERELALMVYLIGVSRLLPRPLAGIVRGSSTSGKSFVVEHVATLFPPEAVILATQMLSAGRLSKLMPVKGEGGRIESVLIEQEGPIAFTETTTLTRIFEEDANRCLLLQTDETEEQTKRIVTGLAARHAVQRLIPTVEVRVLFAEQIADRLDCRRVEVRRAFPQLLSLIQASAMLHFRQRVTAADGALLATAADRREVVGVRVAVGAPRGGCHRADRAGAREEPGDVEADRPGPGCGVRDVAVAGELGATDGRGRPGRVDRRGTDPG